MFDVVPILACSRLDTGDSGWCLTCALYHIGAEPVPAIRFYGDCFDTLCFS